MCIIRFHLDKHENDPTILTCFFARRNVNTFVAFIECSFGILLENLGAQILSRNFLLSFKEKSLEFQNCFGKTAPEC